MKTTKLIPSRPPMPIFSELAEVLVAGDHLRIIYQPFTSRFVHDAITKEIVTEGENHRYQVRTLAYTIEIMSKGDDGKWSSAFLQPQVLESLIKKVKEAQGIEYLVDTWEE